MTLNYQKMARFMVKLSWLLLNVELQKPSSVTCGRYFTTQTSSSWIYSFVNLFGDLKPFISKLSVSKYFFLTFFVIQFQFNSVWPTKTVLWNIYWILISLNVGRVKYARLVFSLPHINGWKKPSVLPEWTTKRKQYSTSLFRIIFK